MTDSFSPFDAILSTRAQTSPWEHEAGEPPRFVPDYGLLERVLSVPVSGGALVVSGRFAAGIDAWLAQELRRAGFGADEVWPRATRPRVLPRDLAVLLQRLPPQLRDQVAQRMARMPAIAPSEARILGRAYDKQVDVVIARWDRGPELLVSTKAQLSSFAKNLPNQFEEAYGDAGNLRSRYPLAAVGFFFVQRATVLVSEPEAFERTVDMVRKLRDMGAGNGYTATGLLLVDWSEPVGQETSVRVALDEVPEDVAPPQFFAALVDHVLKVTPVQHHVAVREGRERRSVPVAEADAALETVEEEAPGVFRRGPPGEAE